MIVDKVPILETEDRDVELSDAEILWNAIPRQCPITGNRLFMIVEHLTRGFVPVYGSDGAFYTIPINIDGELVRDQWDMGMKTWITGCGLGVCSIEL